MRERIGTVVSAAMLMLVGGTALGGPDGEVGRALPRWREGGTPPVDPNQALYPYAVTAGASAQVPTSGVIASPPEYAPCHGVIFWYNSGVWSTEVTDCVSELTGYSYYDEIAYVVVTNSGQQSNATSQFTAAGADMSKVQFLIMPGNSIWLRDYGPHFIWQNGALAIVDSHYYPTRPRDNFSPTLTADDHFLIPSYDIGLYYSGGNGYTTSLVHTDNPGFGDAFIGELFQTYQGIETLHIFPRLPSSVDGTGHIDMWFYLVDEDTVIISEFLPGSHPTAIQITNDAAVYMEGQGFEVIRVPDHNGYNPGDPQCHYTYTNAYRVNDRIFIPVYGGSHSVRDDQAIAAWEAAAPEARIVPINCYNIIWAAGAIHCIVMQVPRYENPVPGAHVVSPDGGELLVSGNGHDVTWSAIDDQDVSSIDLAYSTDGGSTFPYTIATGETNDGHFRWTVPGPPSTQVKVRATAHDGDSNSANADSESTFVITAAPQTVYDFSAGAGVDKWAWGYQTYTWTSIGGTRHPVGIELSGTNYARIAASDASGSDSDPNRYISTTPSSGYETTHVFEFTILEDPSLILDIGILWEGYGDDCTQMEMYVWDENRGEWGDGTGLWGQNRFMDNFAGNRDAELSGHISGEFGKYLDPDGLLTVLLYGERYGDRSFHDYMSVTVTHRIPEDLDGDGIVGVNDFLLLLAGWGPCPPDNCPADIDGNGQVDVNDFLLLLAAWT
ncbi:MAG: agmatine deiminase family protein [Planctomycetota bacterium]|jgi:agmatine/peptidylarginine deiminase